MGITMSLGEKLSSSILQSVDEYPYKVELHSWPPINELAHWCSIEFGKKGTPSRKGRWMIRQEFGFKGWATIVLFRREDDAAFFKLTWT